MTGGATDDTLIGSRFIDDEKKVETSGREIPGAVCWAMTSSGALFPPKCVGKRSMLPDAKPMSIDTVIFLASSTKLVTAVAALQCVERGLIGLDNPIGELLPELQSGSVITGWKEVEGGGPEEPILRPAETKMTFRQLLNHTSGISSAIFDPVYQKYNDWKGWPQKAPTGPEYMIHPLRFDPGTKWQYGFGIDWAGILVGRLNNCTLGEYFQKNIFDPLEMKSTTFRPMKDPSIPDRLAGIAVREKDGSFKPESFDLWLRDSEKIAMDSGGYGLFSTAEDYATFLQTFISDEPVLLKKETIDEMFRPQLPSAYWLRENALDQKLIPVSGNVMFPESLVNHGLGFVLADEDLPTGCKSGSGQGAGLTNTYWWIDRKAWVAGLVFLNMLPYMDTESVKLWVDFQTEVYKELEKK